MIIEIDEKTHTYSVNGDIASISVTELLQKHGLSPDFSGVNKQVLRKKAEKGKGIHKDLENVLKTANYEPKTEQGKLFQTWVEENLDCGTAEQPLAYEYNGMIIAGTADIMGIMKNGDYLLADHKNTAKFEREYVAWQVSLLDYFARKLGKEKVNGKQLNWKGAKQFKCFHYDLKKSTMEVKKLDKVPDVEIERLIECEYNGEIYQRAVLVVENELVAKFEQAENFLKQKQEDFEIAKKEAELVREELRQLFERQGIKSWETPNLKVTYIYPTERISVDSAKLKANYPQVYSECQKLTQVRSSIRITFKEKDEE